MSTFKTFLIAAAFVVSPVAAQKLVAIDADKGSQATVTWTDGNGQPQTRPKYDTNRDGKIEIVVPEGVTSVVIGKYSDGEWITYRKNV